MISFLLRWLARLSPWMFIASLAYAALFIELKADQIALQQPLLEKRDRFFGAAHSGDHLWFVGGDGVLLDTPDAGNSWTRQQLPGGLNLQSTASSPEGIRVVVGNQASVYVGQLGGDGWRRYVLPLPDYANKLNQVQYLNGAFWVVGEMGAVYRLTDTGLTWKDYSLGQDLTINAIALAPDGALWLAAEFGNLFRSADYGNNWTQINLSEESFRSLHFRDGQAVVVGNGGQLFISSDNGASWQQSPTFTREHLFDVTWHAGNWVVVGDQGEMFITESPSSDWTKIAPEDMSKSFFMRAIPVEAGIVLAGKTLGLVDNNKRWVNWPQGE